MTESPQDTAFLSSIKERIAFLNQEYDRVNQEAVHAEAKGGVILSFHTAWMVGVAYQGGKLVIDFSAATTPKFALWALTLLSLTAFVISFACSSYKAFMILFPSVARCRADKPGLASLLFFGEIAALTEGSLMERAQAYAGILNQTSDEALTRDYVNRICDVSKVVQIKFRNARSSIRYSIVTFGLWVCTLLLFSALDQVH